MIKSYLPDESFNSNFRKIGLLLEGGFNLVPPSKRLWKITDC